MIRTCFSFVRFLECVTGVYFIVGAIPKALDIDKFSVQMAAYKVLESPEWLLPASFATVFVEIFLGVALLIGLRLRGLVYLIVQGMIVFFSCLILYAWIYHGLEDCGCFPMIAMSPPVSLAKNGIIILACAYMWRKLFLSTRLDVQEKECIEKCLATNVLLTGPTKYGMPSFKFFLSAILGIVAVAVSFFRADFSALNAPEENGGGIYSQFEIFSDTGYFNLNDGIYLVPILSTSCPECKAKVPELNALWALHDLPPIIALCYEDSPGDLESFKALTNPDFPTYSLGDRALLYFTLIDKEPFKFAIVQDGRQVISWDGVVPTYDEIISSLPVE